MYGLLKVSYFLFSVIFNLLFFILWIRIALRFFKVSALHPFAQGIYRLTQPLFHFFEKFTKPIQHKRLDITSFLFICILELMKFSLLFWLLSPRLPWSLLPLYILLDLVIQPMNLLFYAILIHIILSFLNPTLYSPFRDFLNIITKPVIRQGRRVISDHSGFDFAPYFTLIILKILVIFMSNLLPLDIF